VTTTAEINEVFDPIAYQKTAGVLGMVEAYVGPEKFRQGVSSYLAKYSLGNAAGEDFWNEMTRVTEKPVNRIMKSFVDQPGAPMLTAKTTCVNGSTEVALTQRRFAGTPDAAQTLAPQHWTLPVCVKTATGPATCTIVTEPSQTIRAPGCGATMINADAHGYYFTDYDAAALTALARRTPPLSAPEKISLLGDEWRMARAGRHDIGQYLDLAAAFASDTTPEVADEIASRVNTVMSDIADAGQRQAFEAWMRKQFRPALDTIGLRPKEGDSDEINSLRGILVQSLSSDPDVQTQARELVERYLEQPAALPPTLVAPMLQVAAAGGDSSLYDQYVARMNASVANPEEYYRFFNALATFKTPELRTRTLQFALSADVRTQDTPLLLAQLLVSPWSQDAAWAFVTAQWNAVLGKVGSFRGMPTVANALSAFCSAEKSAEIKAFFAAHPVPEAARTLQQSYERIAACVAVDARQSPAFTRWLASH
jgi:aminopeptidase N